MSTIVGSSMEDITLSIFVPCFNEENDIVTALNNIKEGVQNINYEVLVVDDASTDKTLELIEKFKKNNPNINIKIIPNKINKGLGYNFWETAKKAQGKYYMSVFGDGGIPPNELKKLTSNIGKADIILAYFNDQRGFFRKLLSKLFVFGVNLITSNNIKYYNSDNIYLLENVKSFKNGGSGFAYQAELITDLLRQKKSYVEIEIKIPFETEKSMSTTSQALKLHNVVSVLGSVISIFLKQIVHVVKKLFFLSSR